MNLLTAKTGETKLYGGKQNFMQHLSLLRQAGMLRAKWHRYPVLKYWQ